MIENKRAVIYSFLFGLSSSIYLIILQYPIKMNYNSMIYTHILFFSLVSFILNFISRNRKVTTFMLIPSIFSIFYGILDYLIILSICNNLKYKSYIYNIIFLSVILFCVLIITMKLSLMSLPIIFINLCFLQLILRLEIFEITSTGFDLANIEFGLIKKEYPMYNLVLVLGILMRFFSSRTMKHYSIDRNYAVLSAFSMFTLSLISVLYNHKEFIQEFEIISNCIVTYSFSLFFGAISYFLITTHAMKMDFHYIIGFECVFLILSQLLFKSLQNNSFFVKSIVEKKLISIYFPFLLIPIVTLIFIYLHKKYYYIEDL
ncbi:hypothetical protein CWI39_0392p0010 [Hamiltosporidium magnivora]|uniref:Uncharacterized protein n=1 Tax=Hamiltosporidium magnivora TaxID=148818 RepID=A0A4Q9LGA3_9MICR|nr:hypothetical protein CWI39_0392p0010 [Hamiltosporidium magnivora]